MTVHDIPSVLEHLDYFSRDPKAILVEASIAALTWYGRVGSPVQILVTFSTSFSASLFVCTGLFVT